MEGEKCKKNRLYQLLTQIKEKEREDNFYQIVKPAYLINGKWKVKNVRKINFYQLLTPINLPINQRKKERKG